MTKAMFRPPWNSASEPVAYAANASTDEASKESLRAEIATLRAELPQFRATEHQRDRLARILEASPDFIGIATP